jgi:NAD+ kinase
LSAPGLVATVVTHRRPEETGPAVLDLIKVARKAGARLVFDPREAEKHGLEASDCVELAEEPPYQVDLCFALGGDGTILRGLRRYAGTGVPVFGVNFGEVGFLATVEREDAHAAFERAFAREFEVLALPGIAARVGEADWIAINDVSVERKHGQRVATLAYSVGEDEIGSVRCDGLVVATPAGSTGYNLANGGPVMAWGVAGMVISFIAPHSLTARALVVAPGDVLAIENCSDDEPVDVVVDGRPVATLAAGGRLEARFVHNQGSLAQLAGISFYGRLHEKFGRLATLR